MFFCTRCRHTYIYIYTSGTLSHSIAFCVFYSKIACCLSQVCVEPSLDQPPRMPGNPLGEIASLMNLTTDLREASCFPLEVSIKEGSLNPHSHDSYKIWLFLAVHLTSKTMLIPNSFNCVEGEPIVHFCMYFLFLLTQLSLDSIHII